MEERPSCDNPKQKAGGAHKLDERKNQAKNQASKKKLVVYLEVWRGGQKLQGPGVFLALFFPCIRLILCSLIGIGSEPCLECLESSEIWAFVNSMGALAQEAGVLL